MKKYALLLCIFLSGCATLGLSQYGSKGLLNRLYITGDISTTFKDFDSAEKELSRGSKMVQAGALIEAKLYSPAYKKIQYLREAVRTRESSDQITKGLSEIDASTNLNRLCFMTYLEHATIDLAKPSRWKLKVRLDDGQWVPLVPVSRDDVPNYVLRGGSADWTNAAHFCEMVSGWTNAKTIELNVFPPVFVNPGETTLVWTINY